VPILHAIVLGMVQGFSEFLPISSSGHLLLVPWLFGWNDLEDESIKKAFDVALHLGTLVAVVAYFRKDLVIYVREGLRAIFRRQVPPSVEGKLALYLVLSVVPAAVVGAVFERWIDTALGGPVLIGISLILGGLLLAWADRLHGHRHLERYAGRDALVIGAAQALALNPGTSRSGITITAARMLKFDRDASARISFLMSIPVIIGAIVFKLGKLAVDGVPEGLVAPMIAGVVAAGVSGWIAVWGTLRLVRTYTFDVFVFYRVVLGVIVLALAAVGFR
jgi:undecaprenyl-diphosphatase